jgi:hypothetical protein
MGFGQKIIPVRIDMDTHESLCGPNVARYIKNLIYSLEDTSTEAEGHGSQTGVYKPLRSNAVYVDDFVLPAGTIQSMGAFSFKDTKQAFFMTYSAKGNHAVFRINGDTQTIDTVYLGPPLNFQLNPQYFISQTGCWLEVIYVTDPDTGLKRRRSFLFFTEGFNDQRFICVEDAIATKGFNPVIFPYFQGDYDPKLLINMGVPSSNDCIGITEVPVDVNSQGIPNKLLFNTWQFRVRHYDVWGRPSDYGIISDPYIPIADCLSSSSGAARCLQLLLQAPPPYINQLEIAYRNCNSPQWYKSDTLDLYTGSPLGDWWLRPRNPNVNFDPNTGKITYQFCADKECDPIAQTDTSIVSNPLPKTSQSVAKIDKYIGLGNNKDGFNPFPQTLKDKIKITVEPPSAQASDVNNFRNIAIWVEIFNFSVGVNSVILYKSDQKSYWFQNFQLPSNALNITNDYKQTFKNPNQRGFIGYFAGTNIFTISDQYSIDRNGAIEKVTDFTPSSFDSNKRYFHKFTFSNVKRATYVFRIAGLTVDPAIDSTSVMFKTSTYVMGAFPFNISNPISPVDHNRNNIVSHSKELIINVCDKDYDGLKDNKMLVIADFTNCGGPVDQGYVLNTDDTTQDQFGIELLKVSGGFNNSYQTDHNGYFFAQFTGTGHYYISGYCDCKIVNFANNVSSGTSHIQFTDNYFLNKNTLCTDYSISVCNFILIKGKILLCGSEIGVPGISVVISRGSSVITDANGNFTIIVHDDIVNLNSPNTRFDKLYFISNSCNFTDCNGACIPPISVVINSCTSCQPREVDVTNTIVKSIGQRGLLSGGVYPIGIGRYDWLKRTGFVQTLGSLSIPTVNETKLFAPSRVRVDISPDAVFPDDTNEITFYIGTETTIADYITWIIDSVQFIDNTGLENNISPTQIKIFYASLVEYNKQNNFNTTVNWNFLIANAANTSSSPSTTDKVEFLLNGDGTFFPKAITALIKYDSTGQFFLINYTSDLKNLLPNAIMRLVRPKQCTGTEPFFELCSTIKIIKGKASINRIYLNAFDTYYVFRQIPVPTAQPVIQPATTPTFINETRVLGVPFEHNSPSDFWGQGCANFGRVNIKNEQEAQLYHEDQIALSGAISQTGQLNFLCSFDDNRKADFSDTNINGITGIVSETGTVLVIGVSDHFIVGFNDNLFRINQDGTAQAGSIANSFGKPQRKVGENWGCLLFDKNTIYKKEGLVQWLDTTKGVLVQHNFANGLAISKEDRKLGIPGGVDSWLKPKIKDVQNYNLEHGPVRYFHGIINPQTFDYLLTDFKIGSPTPVNNLRDKDVTQNETMAVNIFTKFWKTAFGFTPELYAELEGELSSQQLFSFFKGVPYGHYNELVTQQFGSMFGQPMVRVIEPIISIDNLRNKKPLAIGVICKESQYFSDRVISSTGQQTRMLLGAWIQASFGWFAPFLCDLNTPFDPNRPLATSVNVLTDGNTIIGTYVKIRLIGSPAQDTQYSELQGITISVIPDVTNLDNKP